MPWDNVLDLVAKWIVLVLFFLLLTYPFRDRLILEGFAGYCLIVFVLVPINIAARLYLMESPRMAHENALAILSTTLFALNLLLMFLLNRFLPGLTVSSFKAMVLFVALFTAGAVLAGYIPTIPNLSFSD